MSWPLGCYRLVSERGEGGTALRYFRDTAGEVFMQGLWLQQGYRRTASTAVTAGPLTYTPASNNLWFTHDRQPRGINARYFPAS